LKEQEGLVFLFAGSLDDLGKDGKADVKDGEGEEGGYAGVGIGGVVVEREFWVRDRVGWLGEVSGAVQCQKFV